METLQFEKEYRVHLYDTGPDGKVSLYSLFNYMQDIASEHAVMLGFGRDDLMSGNRFWVLSRMYAVITELPQWNDTIFVNTWPSGTDKLFAFRSFSVYNTERKKIISASSSCLILDHTTRKVQRPDGILPRYDPDLYRHDAPVRNAMKIEAPDENGCTSSEYRIKPSDLDVNLHTNNVAYLRWVTDTYDLDYIMTHFPCEAEINYLAESLYNEEIITKTSADKGNCNVFNHSVIRTGDKKELCRVKLEWKEDSVKKVN